MSTNLFDLTGKRALVTGGVHGLGMAMAKGLVYVLAGYLRAAFPQTCGGC